MGRGRVLDCHGNILALDLAVKNVCVDPRTIVENGHANAIGAHLARLLQLDPAMVFARLSRPNRRFEYIKKFVQEDTTDQIRRMQLKGVFFEDASARYYPKGSMFCHVVGFANQEGIGSAGIEQRLDSYLRGHSGLRISEKDGRKVEMYNRRSLDIEPQQGVDVYLTLDQNLQYIVEKSLDAAIEEYQAKGVWADCRAREDRGNSGHGLAARVRPERVPHRAGKLLAEPPDRLRLRTRLDVQGCRHFRRVE